MKTHFKDFTNTQPLQVHEELDYIENLEIYQPKRLMVFENYWQDSFFNGYNNQSCQPFLENISQMIGEPLNVCHRHVSSKTDLEYYLKSPGGVIWDHPETFSVVYFGLHGSHLGCPLPQGLISKADVLELCSGFKDFPNVLLHFGSCSLFENDDKFGYDLLACGKPGICGVLGYKEEIPFNIGLLIDLFFLSSFFLYKDGDPFEAIEGLYKDVIKEFPLAKDLGFTLYC